MTLQEYFKLSGTDRNEFAKEIGVDPITVYRWENNKRFPRDHIRKIMQATGGKVTANDFVDAITPADSDQRASA